MSESYHIEAIGPEVRGRRAEIVQRVSMRVEGLVRVRERAVRLLQRSQLPQWAGDPVEAVRVVDGTGVEVFRWSVWDEMSRITER